VANFKVPRSPCEPIPQARQPGFGMPGMPMRHLMTLEVSLTHGQLLALGLPYGAGPALLRLVRPARLWSLNAYRCATLLASDREWWIAAPAQVIIRLFRACRPPTRAA